MITAEQRFQPRQEEVAAKVMDGEAILINLSNGIYYSMDKVGGLIWEMIEGKRTIKEIISGVVDRYDVSLSNAQADVERLMEELAQENLIAVLEGDDGAAVSPGVESNVTEKLAYEAPKLNIYRDMGDLLALDPPTPGLQDINWKDPDEKKSR